MDFHQLRDSIVATREVAYFNTGWAGPSPEPVVSRIAETFERECRAGPASLESVRQSREALEQAREAAGTLLGAEADEIAMTHGTTEGVHVVLHGFPWKPDDELLSCTLEHAALSTPAAVLAERRGVVATRLDIPPDASEEEQLRLIRDALTPHTRIVALSHIQYSCGLRMPVREISDLAHQAGALVLVDGAQSAGQLALDVRELGVDFYAISGQKWLLGPQGTGALFIAAEHARLIDPLFTTHALADRRAEASETAGASYPLQRFRVTSQSTPLLAGFIEAVRILEDVGLDTIEARVNDLASRLRAGIATIGGCHITGPREGPVTSGLVSVAIDGWEPRQVVEALWERWRIAARAVAHPAAVRFCTHAFNTEAEVDALVAALETLAGERAGSAPAAGA